MGNIFVLSSIKNAHIEATPFGVNVSELSDSGLYEHVALFSYEDVIRRLEAGEFDGKSEEAKIIRALVVGLDRGYFQATIDNNLVIWRHLVAITFYIEQLKKNGFAESTDMNGEKIETAFYRGDNGSMPVYLFAERQAMANNIEGALIERYGAEQGKCNAVMFYREMIDGDGLSDMGRDVLNDLHESFIAAIESGDIPDIVTH
ncbi:MAG: hypothetical protein XXXJIFNMEKO3_00614 [Candidatus Erwinia impunctatus]|nr:hypothetical protein XXXJIFNMEKO_00614 [Culicoides impunctatus]